MTAIVLAGLVLVQYGVTMYYFRIPFVDDIVAVDDWVPLDHRAVAARHDPGDQPDRRPRRPRRRHRGDRRRVVLPLQPKLSDLGLLTPPNFGPLVAIIAVGMCVGFLPHNFNPARIIMGDSGALLLGLLMAVSTSVVGGRADPSGQGFIGQTYFFLAPLVIPLLILGVPILDLVFAVVRRASDARRSTSPTRATSTTA